jgi:hypothetical protein
MRFELRRVNVTCIFVAAVALLAASAETARGQGRLSGRGSASGFVIFSDGKTERRVELKYAYASYRAQGMSEPLSPWQVLLTDVSLPDDPYERGPFFQQLRRDRKLNALWLNISGGGGVTSSVGNCGSCNQPDEPSGWQAVWWEREKRKQSFNATALSDRIVAGTARSLSLATGTTAAYYRYEVTFRAALRESGLPVTALSANDDEPGRAFSRFYKAIKEQDLGSARALMARDIADVLEGAEPRRTLARLGRLIQRYDKVMFSQVYSGGRSAQILVGREVQRERPLFTHVPTTRTTQPMTLPFPIPPVDWAFRDDAPESEVGSYMPFITTVRLVLEDGFWKVYWLLDHEHYNVLLKDYLNPEERWRASKRGKKH